MNYRRVADIHRKMWLVRCKDIRMPQTPMTLAMAKEQAEKCDRFWPDCGPHEITTAGGER